MTLDPDHDAGYLSPNDCEKLERILIERSEGSYGVTALNGILTASEVGPETIPLDWILETVLTPPEPDLIGFDDFPDFKWVKEKIEEWFLRIRRALRQDPEKLRLLVHRPNKIEGDTAHEPVTWANGFAEGMAYHQEKWAPLFEWGGGRGFKAVVPILMISDADGWETRSGDNPFKQLPPWKQSETCRLAAVIIYTFWYLLYPSRTSTPASTTRGRNDPCPCGSGKKFKRCCGRSA
jgi:uncharacterized protein